MDSHYTSARYSSASTAEYPQFYTAPTPERGSPEPAEAYPTPDASPRSAAHRLLPHEEAYENIRYQNANYQHTSSQNTGYQAPVGYATAGYDTTSTEALVAAATRRLRSASFTLPCSMCGSRAAGQCYVVCAVTGEENANCAHVRALALERQREVASAGAREREYTTTSDSDTTGYGASHLTVPTVPRRGSGARRECYARR
ncbi:hypothetical protein HYPSUDRAFT_49773 [Hypholoma sublateritium FD-334 SS-4]|uniref:Uncharacterized protein n=1 Tax=Hypholoma sublateritium (strain FD-334 SS-4) TaxID=945553 RepID=A0A0D2KGD1_HYPSF|nr:hypothetical protein HYPSUDRAFT_49773 [Hypholoma sublateritium FD-334 SS-4]